MYMGRIYAGFFSLLLVALVSAEGKISSLFDLRSCPKFRIRKSTIIQSKKSVDDGAIYLGKKTVSSARGCHELCCKKEGCNLVTLKYDVDSSVQKVTCFMFDCRSPSVCSFYQHSSYRSYAALEYGDTKSLYSSQEVGKKNDYKDHDDPVMKTTTTQATYFPTTTERAYQDKHWDWFKATTTTKPKYMKPKHKSGFDGTHSQVSKNNWLDDQVDKVSSTHDSYKTSNTKHANSWHNTPKSTDYHSDDKTKYGTYDHTADKNSDPTMKSTDGGKGNEEEDFPRRVFVDNNPDFPDEPRSHYEKTTAKPKTVVQSRTTRAATKLPVTKPPATKPPVSNVVIRKLNIQENKAVIPLAVGLVLALLLLMGVIFRLKSSRRRRTKAFLTDDADYLINGMYL